MLFFYVTDFVVQTQIQTKAAADSEYCGILWSGEHDEWQMMSWTSCWEVEKLEIVVRLFNFLNFWSCLFSAVMHDNDKENYHVEQTM